MFGTDVAAGLAAAPVWTDDVEEPVGMIVMGVAAALFVEGPLGAAEIQARVHAPPHQTSPIHTDKKKN